MHSSPDETDDGPTLRAVDDRPAERITVLIVEDSPVFLDALGQMIGADDRLHVVGMTRDGKAAQALIDAEKPSVVLLDLRIPEVDGIALIRWVQARGSDSRILVLSEHDEGEQVYDAILAGGAGFLSKATEPEDICEAIVRIARGESVFAGGVATGLVSRMRDAARPRLLLTEREHQILERMASGATLKEIGDELHLALPTIKTHAQNLYGRLGVSDRSAAVAEAMRRGLIH